MAKRIVVLTGSPEGSPFRLRIAAMMDGLSARGFDLSVRIRDKNGLTNDDLSEVTAADAVILQRLLLPPSEAATLRKAARRIILDVDDAIMFDHKARTPIAKWLRSRKFNATAKSIDHVAAGNDYLAEQFTKKGCPASILPTVVAPGDYQVKQHSGTDTPRLVWIGSGSTLKYLKPSLAIFAAAKVTGLRLVVICNRFPEKSPIPIDERIWSLADESRFLCEGDIGIAPLPQDPWTRGKCGFKVIQYMAAGLPVIASPVGPQAVYVTNGENGFTPDTDAEWIKAIETLASDWALRQRMGRESRLRIEEKYCVQNAIEKWAALLAL